MSRAVIFDVDGVLVDSYQPHFESWVRLFKELGHEHTEKEFQDGFGRTSDEILHQWSAEHGANLSDQQVDELGQRKELLYREVVCENFVAIDGVTELIEELHADGWLLGVGSSGPPENVAVVLERLAGAEHFQAVVSRADVRQGKPHPEVFLLGAERLGVSPTGCAVIEDAVPGITAANSAGMCSIGLIGTATREQLASAMLVVNSLGELSPQAIQRLIASRSGGE